MLILQGTDNREVKQLGLGHTARRQKNRDGDPGGLALELTFSSRIKNWTQVLPEVRYVIPKEVPGGFWALSWEGSP